VFTAFVTAPSQHPNGVGALTTAPKGHLLATGPGRTSNGFAYGASGKGNMGLWLMANHQRRMGELHGDVGLDAHNARAQRGN
jgi:hypothetical protein